MDVNFVTGGSGSKFLNLAKGIEKRTTPQHRTHCTPPPHNSSKHDEHPVTQYLLPSYKYNLPAISRLSKLLHSHPRGNHERWETRLISSLRTQTPFSINSSLQPRADHRGPFANVLTSPMGPQVNQPPNQPTTQPTNHPTTHFTNSKSIQTQVGIPQGRDFCPSKM